MMFEMLNVKINKDILQARPFEWVDNLPSKYMLTCPECAQLLVLDDNDLFRENDYYIFKLTEEKFKIHNNKCPLSKNVKYLFTKNDKPTLKEILDNELLHVKSEITTVKRMLDDSPDDEAIDNNSLKCRLNVLNDEYEQLKNNYEFSLDINEYLQKIIDENTEIVYGNK